MKEIPTTAIMASYATFKELYNSEKYRSPYQILSEFIKYILVSKSLYTFTATDVQSNLNSEFGFCPPIAVIRTAMKSIPEVKLIDSRYQVRNLQNDVVFQTCRQQAEEKSNSIIDALIQFAEEKNSIILDKNKLSQELIAFVMGDYDGSKYQQIISSFFLHNQTNEGIKAAMSAIHEGSILYAGLAHNISEFGSLKKQITLFLDTEILFHIAGLNGDIYKTLADDFLKLVNAANHGGKKIKLKYFSKVEKEINNFYESAEQIVSGHGILNPSSAMKSIIDGCKDVSDVSDKKVDLFCKLHNEYGIEKDDKENYYTDSDTIYNLEGLDFQEYPNADDQNGEGYMFCSHINKLRKGKQTTDLLSSKYLCVTNTRRVLEISHAITEQEKNPETGERYCDYAVNLSYITNLLWYKLNRGFGSTEFPKNLDVVIKARTILSGYITQGITTTFKDIRKKADSGELNQDRVVERIAALREKKTLPEELNVDSIEKDLDFSEEYFVQYEENQAQNRKLLLENKKTIEELSGNVKELQGKLSQEATRNDEKQHVIDILTEKINALEEPVRIKERKKRQNKARLKFMWAVSWKLLVVIAFGVVGYFICKQLNVGYGEWLGAALGAITPLGIFVGFLKKDFKKYKEG